MKITIRLEDEFSRQDLTVIQEVPATLEALFAAFKTFALAAQYHPDLVKEYFDAAEG